MRSGFFFFFNFFLYLKLFHRGFSLWFFLHALVQVLDEEDELPELELPSSCHLSRLLLLAFMKKLLTVLSSSPSCWEMVICNSLDGRLFSLNIAWRVRRWTSVKTNLGFLGVLPLSFPCSCSFLLQAPSVEVTSRHRWGPQQCLWISSSFPRPCCYQNGRRLENHQDCRVLKTKTQSDSSLAAG